MARRGDSLTEHILWTAKDVFLEMGFERASMDLKRNVCGTQMCGNAQSVRAGPNNYSIATSHVPPFAS